MGRGEGTDRSSQLSQARSGGNERPPQLIQTSLRGIAETARRDKEKRFFSLYSFLNRPNLETAYYGLNRKAAPGVDDVDYKAYGANLAANLDQLAGDLKAKRYRAKLVRRVYIPKSNGKMRPLGIPAVADKLAQSVAAQVLEAIFEPDFHSFSYAYRPGKSARQAVEHIQKELRGKYSWVVEADIKGFFDSMDHGLLVRMLEKRINDAAFIRLIQKWLKAGVLEDGKDVVHPETGTPQGGIISPILANIYLHYALDKWFVEKFKPRCKGEAFLVRYADDFVAAFRFRREAVRFKRELRERMELMKLALSAEKTRGFLFTRFRKEESRPFQFLGFEFRWGISRLHKDIIKVRTAPQRFRAVLRDFKDWCREHRNKRIAWIMGYVKMKLRGFYNYFDVIGNSLALMSFHDRVKLILFRWLNRRSQRRSYTWPVFARILSYFNLRQYQSRKPEAVQLKLFDSDTV
jgi:RNA-directed DNA polymerase